MKTYNWIFLYFIFASCVLVSCLGLIVQCSRSSEIEQKSVVDTVYIEVPVLNEERIKELEADVEYWKNIVDSMNASIPYDYYINCRRVEKIRYYISITEKNPNNKKFFFGWVKRTMSDK